MEKADKTQYHSDGVLGKLYDLACKRSDGDAALAEAGQRRGVGKSGGGGSGGGGGSAGGGGFDPDLVLDGELGFWAEVAAVTPLCVLYNAELLRLLNRFGIMSEAELLTGWVVHPTGLQRRKEPEDLRQQVLLDVGAMRNTFLTRLRRLDTSAVAAAGGEAGGVAGAAGAGRSGSPASSSSGGTSSSGRFNNSGCGAGGGESDGDGGGSGGDSSSVGGGSPDQVADTSADDLEDSPYDAAAADSDAGLLAAAREALLGSASPPQSSGQDGQPAAAAGASVGAGCQCVACRSGTGYCFFRRVSWAEKLRASAAYCAAYRIARHTVPRCGEGEGRAAAAGRGGNGSGGGGGGSGSSGGGGGGSATLRQPSWSDADGGGHGGGDWGCGGDAGKELPLRSFGWLMHRELLAARAHKRNNSSRLDTGRR